MSFPSSSKVNNPACNEDQLCRNVTFTQALAFLTTESQLSWKRDNISSWDQQRPLNLFIKTRV